MKIEVSEYDVMVLADDAAERAKNAVNNYEWDEARQCIEDAEALLALLPDKPGG